LQQGFFQTLAATPQWLLRDDVFGGGEAARGCDPTLRDDDGINKDNHDIVNQ
jgi:hypothetical protein